MVLHEFGHAAASWLTSRIAIPTVGVTVPLQSEPSIVTFLFLVGLGLWWHLAAHRAGYRFLAAIPVVTAPILVVASWILPLKRANQFVLLAGQGGELILSALFILLFFEPMPRFFNWGVNRFLFLIIAGCTLLAASIRWFKAKSDLQHLPMGSFFEFNRMFGDSSESMGDIDRLIRDFSWTAEGLVSFYLFLTVATLVTLFGAYFFMMYRADYSNEG